MNSESNRTVVNSIVKEKTRADIYPITLSIICDKICFKRPLKPKHRLSCFVQGMDQLILFDTGRCPDVPLGNVANLGLDTLINKYRVRFTRKP